MRRSEVSIPDLPKMAAYDAAGNIVLIVDVRPVHGRIFDMVPSVRRTVLRTGRSVRAEMYAILQSSPSSLRLEFFNPDWSTEPLCGNALRAAACYLAGGLGRRAEATVETAAGEMIVFVDGRRAGARVPASVARVRQVDGDLMFEIGTPHRVRFTDDLSARTVEVLGRQWSRGTGAVNATFVRKERNRIGARTFERGVGETRSCGTGAIAAALAVGMTQPDSDAWKRRVTFASGESLLVKYSRASEAFELTGRIRTLRI